MDEDLPLPPPPPPPPIIVTDDSSIHVVMASYEAQAAQTRRIASMAMQNNNVVYQDEELAFPAFDLAAELLLGSELVVLGNKTSDGQIIEAVAAPWLAIFKELQRDPEFLLRFEPRQMEELIAASYKELGYRVELTPRSGDGGRDVIAIHDGLKVRFLDQVKRYAHHHIVTAEEVRALFGVVSLDPAASKGVMTTTSDFAPGIAKEFEKVMPYKLELRNGVALRKLIKELAGKE